ncbi:MAG: hypothetical protein QXH27_04045 [Candidatus Micrarchaeia archaeon]
MEYGLFEATQEILDALKKMDITALRKTSNRCTNSLAIEAKKGMLELAIVSYSLAKVLEKPHFWKTEKWDEFVSKTQKKLGECAYYAKEGMEEEFGVCIEGLEKGLAEAEARDRRYVKDVLFKARIKIGSTLYAQGFSLGNAAALVGVSKRDIASYAGKTMIFDRAGKTFGIAERLKKARKLFGK